MSPKNGWRILAEEAKRAGTERLARSLPGDGYWGGLFRRFLPGGDARVEPSGRLDAPDGKPVVAASGAPASLDADPAARSRIGSMARERARGDTRTVRPGAARAAQPGALHGHPESVLEVPGVLRLAPTAVTDNQQSPPLLHRGGAAVGAVAPADNGAASAAATTVRPRSQFRPGRRAPSFAAGDVIAERLEITRQLACTRKHTTYLARHRHFGVEVAVKVPRDELLADPRTLQSIEASALRWIALGLHPHVAYCYQVEVVEGVPVLITEYLDGGSLGPWIASARTRNLRVGLNLAIQICHGLEHAHAREVWHGSLDAENLLLTSDGTLRIGDFGTPRSILPEDAEPNANLAGGACVAPELWINSSLMDAKSDVFALGVCLYEMLCGSRPFVTTRGSRQESCGETELATLPERLRALLQQCVDWDQAQRPPVVKIRQELCALHAELFGKPSPFAVLPAPTWDADGWNNQAAAAWLAGRNGDADAAWARALQVGRDHLEAAFNSGIARWRRGDLSDVDLLQVLDQIATRRPRDWSAAYLRALVHLERGDAAAAVSLLEQATTLVPESSEVRDAVTIARMQADAAQRESPKVTGHEAHQAFVSSVCVHPDGRWVLSGGDDRNLRLWDVTNGRLLRTLGGHTRRVSGIAVSEDGTLAVSGGDDATLRLWDLQTGRCRKKIDASGKVFGVALSPNGRWAAATSGARETAMGVDGTLIQVWDLETERCLSELPGHGRAVRSVALSADGRRLLSGADDHTVRLWDVATKTQLLLFEGHTHFVSCVRMNADATRALSASWDQTIRVWDLPKKRCARVLKGHVSIVTCVALSRDGSVAVSGSLDGTVRVWDLDSGCCLRTFEGHTSMVTSVALSADGRLASSASWDGTVRIWPMPRRSRAAAVPRLSVRTAYARLPSAEPEPDELLSDAEGAFQENRLAQALAYLRQARQSTTHDASARAISLWRELTPRCQRTGLRATRLLTAQAGPERTGGVQVTAAPERILSAGRDGRLQWWDADFGRSMATLTGHRARVLALRLSVDHALAVSASADGTARVWDLRRGACVHTLAGHESVVTAVDLTADAQRLLTASYDHTLRVWSLAIGECVQVLRGHRRQILTACLTPDGRRVASAGYEPVINAWDAERGTCMAQLEGHSGAVTALCASADGRWLLSGSADHSLRLWSFEDGECVRVLGGHQAPVVAAALTPDARWALSASRDGSVRLWALESGECVHIVHREEGAIAACALSADGCRAVVAGADDVLRLYELEWDLEALPL